jgi:hypothetical protein
MMVMVLVKVVAGSGYVFYQVDGGIGGRERDGDREYNNNNYYESR